LPGGVTAAGCPIGVLASFIMEASSEFVPPILPDPRADENERHLMDFIFRRRGSRAAPLRSSAALRFIFPAFSQFFKKPQQRPPLLF